jgi:ribosomal protein L16 Arg81 hydroxylase
MTNIKESFAELISPISEDEFFSLYHDKKYLHIPATDPNKFAEAMSWEILTNLLNMTSIWSSTSLAVYLDTTPIPADQYCRQAIDRNNQSSLQPDAEKVKNWLKRGASLVANDIDALWPGTSAISDALEKSTGGRAQANLYCSWNQHQAFETHFDNHEVFAIHIAGEKIWRVYEGRLENPISDEATKNLSKEYHKKNRGPLLEEITLRPGDLLYIPRGQYHDALASSDSAIHLSFGLTHIIGYDILQLLFEQAMANPLFRSNIPLPAKGAEARKKWIKKLISNLQNISISSELHGNLDAYTKTFRYFRGGFNLPEDAYSNANNDRYTVVVSSLKVLKKNNKFILQSEKGGVAIPYGLESPISWIIKKGNFSLEDLISEHPKLTNDDCDKLISNLLAMKAIAPG